MLVRRASTPPARIWWAAAAALPFLLPEPLDPSSRAFAQAPPPEYVLTAIVRDFRGRQEPGGHPDFERNKAMGLGGLTEGAVFPNLHMDGTPSFAGGTKVLKIGSGVFDQWTDSAGRPICFRLFDSFLGDTAGSWSPVGSSAFTNAANFNQWYHDSLGVNISTAVSLTVVRQGDGTYVFDDKTDPVYGPMGGFFPIDGQLFGNSVANPSHNFHFTTEIRATFTYETSAGQIFKFIGDDDVWVFINKNLVIDLGGTHSAQEQYLDLTRLGLTDGQTYTLDLFHAERQTDSSNFRFQTNMLLEDISGRSISGPFD